MSAHPTPTTSRLRPTIRSLSARVSSPADSRSLPRSSSCCFAADVAAAESLTRPDGSMPAEPPVDTPRSLADAYALLAAAAGGGERAARDDAVDGGAGDPVATDPSRLTPIAGGTDVMVRITGEIGEPPVRLLDLWRLDELRGITSDGEAITLGALTTYTDIRRSAACREHLPALVEAAATIG